MINKLIESNKPFAVYKYYEYLKFTQIKSPKYEVIYLNDKGNKSFKVLKSEDLFYFNSIIEKFDKVVDNADGAVWEVLDFKNYYKKLKMSKLEQILGLTTYKRHN